jgi:hypothetical protein
MEQNVLMIRLGKKTVLFEMGPGNGQGYGKIGISIKARRPTPMWDKILFLAGSLMAGGMVSVNIVLAYWPFAESRINLQGYYQSK